MQQATAVNLQQDDNDEIDILGLFGTLIDHKWLIAAITGVFIAIGTGYAILATPVYQANALIQVEAKKNDVLGFSDVSSILRKESPSATEIELIKSRSIIGKTVDDLNLDIIYEPNYFPIIGDFLARKYTRTNPHELNNPLLDMTSFAWGGGVAKN